MSWRTGKQLSQYQSRFTPVFNSDFFYEYTNSFLIYIRFNILSACPFNLPLAADIDMENNFIYAHLSWRGFLQFGWFYMKLSERLHSTEAL